MKIFPNQLSRWKNLNDSNTIIEVMSQRSYCALIIIWCLSIVIYYSSIRIILFDDAPQKIRHDSGFQKTFMRGDIVDRNGRLLCKTIQCYSCFVNPRNIITKDVLQLSRKISQIIGKDHKEIYKKISNKNTSFVWVKRHIDNDVRSKLMALGDPGIQIVEDYSRKAIHKKITKHIIGVCDVDGNGLSYLEKYFDASLKKGEPIILSIDLYLQSTIHNILYEDMKIYNADGANAILMDINSGEILAMVSMPDVDLNRNTSGAFEPGSTFKILNTAVALDSGLVKLRETFATNSIVKIAQYQIRDWTYKDYPLNVGEILIYSSNKGSVLMQRKFGSDIQKKYLESFGLLEKCHVELNEVSKPILPRFTSTDGESISYGYAISVSPLAQLSAIASVLNGGHLVKPTLVKMYNYDKRQAKRVVSEETSKTLAEIMRLVMVYGTGRTANVSDIGLCGKTGTAQKVIKGGYGKNQNITTFVGVFPYFRPRFVILVMYDNPKSNSNLTTAAHNASKTAKKILQTIAPTMMCGETIQESSNEIRMLSQKYMQNLM